MEPDRGRLENTARACTRKLLGGRSERGPGCDHHSTLLRPQVGVDWNGTHETGIPAPRPGKTTARAVPRASRQNGNRNHKTRCHRSRPAALREIRLSSRTGNSPLVAPRQECRLVLIRRSACAAVVARIRPDLFRYRPLTTVDSAG